MSDGRQHDFSGETIVVRGGSQASSDGHQHIYPDMLVFIAGQDVTDDVLSVTTKNALDVKPGTCQITLASPRNKYVMTVDDVASISSQRPDLDIIRDPYPDMLECDPASPQGAPVEDYSAVKWEVVKRKLATNREIYENYASGNLNERMQWLENLKANRNVKLAMRSPEDIRRYDFRTGFSCFHANDPIRIAFRHPYDHTRWYWAFAGFVADVTVTNGEDHDQTVSIAGEDVLRLFRLARTFVNPGQMDQWNVILEGLDDSFYSFTKDMFADMNLVDIFAMIIFGSDATGNTARMRAIQARHASPPAGGAANRTWRGIGKFNQLGIERSRVYVMGDDRSTDQILEDLERNRQLVEPREDTRHGYTYEHYDVVAFYDGQMLPPARVTSAFGTARKRSDGGSYVHRGIDISGPAGQGVMAWHDGVVTHAGPSVSDGGAAGVYVAIRHTGVREGWVSRYMHLSATTVSVGQQVSKNQLIGEMGSTGRSSGVHLHFETIEPGGEHVDPAVHAADYPLVANALLDERDRPQGPTLARWQGDPRTQPWWGETRLASATGLAGRKQTTLQKYRDMLRKIDNLQPYLDDTSHEVKLSDLYEMRHTPPDSLTDMVRDLGRAKDVVLHIGTHPDDYPVDGGRFMALLPGMLADRFDIIAKDVPGSSLQVHGSQFTTRLELLYNVASYINFNFFCTPKGDLVLEFPLDDFNPEHLDAPDADPRELGQIHSYGEDRTISFETLANDSRVKTVAHATWNTVRLWGDLGESAEFSPDGRTMLVDVALLQQYGPRVVAMSPAGYIANRESAEAFMEIQMNRANASAFSVRATLLPHPGLTLNRPLFIYGPYCVGNISDLSFSLTWASGYDMDVTLESVRPWDGSTYTDGRPKFAQIGGPAGKPWDYRLLMGGDDR